MFAALQDWTTLEFLYLAFGALLVGMEKAGFKGLSMLVVSLYAMVMGGKASAGLLLLYFMLADVFAVRYYYREASFSIVRKLVATQDSNRALPGFNWALSPESLIAYVIRICKSITLPDQDKFLSTIKIARFIASLHSKVA